MDQYKKYVARISELESTKNFTDILNIYSELLTRFPNLEGFWVRWAHLEFRTNGVKPAIRIFQKALQSQQYSLIVWVHFLRFLLRIGGLPADEVKAQFEMAESSIGYHFLSHEFWDLKLESSNEKVHLLVKILTNNTLHQFSKYYALLLDQLKECHKPEDLLQFRGILPEMATLEITLPDVDLFKEVIASKLKLQYELHHRRVKGCIEYEKNIKRVAFLPKPVLDSDVKNWLAYAQNSERPLMVMRRALIPCADVPEIAKAYYEMLLKLGLKDEADIVRLKFNLSINSKSQKALEIINEGLIQYSLGHFVVIS